MFRMNWHMCWTRDCCSIAFFSLRYERDFLPSFERRKKLSNISVISWIFCVFHVVLKCFRSISPHEILFFESCTFPTLHRVKKRAFSNIHVFSSGPSLFIIRFGENRMQDVTVHKLGNLHVAKHHVYFRLPMLCKAAQWKGRKLSHIYLLFWCFGMSHTSIWV